jgi:hypothetical protein
MRRALHIAVSLMVVVLLLRPFECFAAGTSRDDAADCCLKGKCVPATNSDACCRNSVPVQDQFVPLKSTGHLAPLIVSAAVYFPVLPPRSSIPAFADPARHPPPRIEFTAPKLPLLI